MLLNTDIKVLCCHTCLLDRWFCFSEHYRHTHVLMYTWGSIHTSHFLWRLCIFNVWRRNMFISVFFHSCHRVRLISRYRQLERNCIRINHREGWKHDSAATGLINFLPQWNRYRSSFFFISLSFCDKVIPKLSIYCTSCAIYYEISLIADEIETSLCFMTQTLKRKWGYN